MIVRCEDLETIRKNHRNESISLAGGVFDLLHPGHLDLFNKMKLVSDIAVVALSSDRRVRQRKGDLRPVRDEQTRLQIVDAIRAVDYSLVAPEPNGIDTPTITVMRALRPDIFLSSEDSWNNHTEIFEELGTEFKLVPRFSDEISTSQTIDKILQTHAEVRL